MVDASVAVVGGLPDVVAWPELSDAVAGVGLGAVAGAAQWRGVVVAGLPGLCDETRLVGGDVVEVETSGDLVGVGEGVGGGPEVDPFGE